jgi:hypothetical protein
MFTRAEMSLNWQTSNVRKKHFANRLPFNILNDSAVSNLLNVGVTRTI